MLKTYIYLNFLFVKITHFFRPVVSRRNYFPVRKKGNDAQLLGCAYMVYFRFMPTAVVGTIPLLERVKPHSRSEVQVIQRAADLADRFGADMGVDLCGLAACMA